MFLRKSLLALSLAAAVTATASATVTLATWNDGKSAFKTSGQLRAAYVHRSTDTANSTTLTETRQKTWSYRTRLTFSLQQYVTDDITLSFYTRLQHTFNSRHQSKNTFSWVTHSYGTPTYTNTHAKNPVRLDRFYTYLESKKFGKLTVALTNGDYRSYQGAADVRDFGTATWSFDSTSSAILRTFLSKQDRLVRYDSPNLSADVPLSFSVSYGDMRSNQTDSNGNKKRRYNTEVAGAIIYDLGSKGSLNLLVNKSYNYANYTTKLPSTGYQFFALLTPVKGAKIRFETGLSKVETLSAYNRYKSIGLEGQYLFNNKINPYLGVVAVHTTTNNKTSGLERTSRDLETYLGVEYHLADKVANTFNVLLFLEGSHVYRKYMANYSQPGTHTYTLGTGLLVLW